jgi:hydroxybutyrate-dimer hydrolase
LKAGEADRDGLLAAVIAGEPNIAPPGARSLYDYSTEAAIYQPCIAASLGDAPALMPAAAAQAVAALRCASLKASGELVGDTPEALVAAARAKLTASGWSEGALKQANINVALDLWRSVVATYAQAYSRAEAATPLCGYRFALKDPAGAARAATAAERALWWSDGAGIASIVGLGIVDGLAAAPDPALPALRCARALIDGKTAEALAVQRGLAEVTATARPHTPLTVIVHGEDDGLVPPAFTSTPYVTAARANGARIAYWQVPHAQHFDAFLAVPDVGARNVPLMPYVYRALEQVLDHLEGRGAAPVDRRFDSTPRGSSMLTARHLGL